MIKETQTKRRILIIGLLLAAVFFAVDFSAGASEGSSAEESAPEPIPEYQEFEELNGKTVSMLNGVPFEDLVLKYVPKVGEFTYYNNTPDMLIALASGKTDAALANGATAELAVNRSEGLAVFPDALQTEAVGFSFEKGSPEREEWQKALDSISEETKAAAWAKWTGSDDSAKVLPEQDWPGKNGTVTVAACDTLEPMCYAGEGGKIQGFDIEIALLMAKELDVHIEFVGMEFSSVLPYVQSGKALFGAGSIFITEERSKAVDFVEYYEMDFVLIVRGREGSSGNTKTLSDLENAKIGVMSGSNHPELVKKHLPNAEILYYNTTADLANALIAGKVDAFATDEPGARSMQAENEGLSMLDERLDSMDYAYGLPKNERGEKLEAELSEYIEELRADGTLEELQIKWFDSPDISKNEAIDYREFSGENGTINFYVNSYPPFVLLKDDIYTGYEVEIVARFCRDRGYGIEVTDITLEGILSSLQSGKCDIAATSLSVTEERKEEILFSAPTYSGGTVIVVLKNEGGAEAGSKNLWESIQESFEKTFIREGRWKLFLSGIGTTLLITILSIVLGTALGFLVFMVCRKGSPIANSIARFFIWLIEGMPVVVLLMILYYIVFGKLSIAGSLVAIIAFTLIFGSAVFNMLKSGVGAIDRGQTEAAYALGYSDRNAFFRVVLPQALPHFMPAYKGQITSLIKATAVVGYIAVQDLTKMGDLIRSRTYEAFFPLIAVAIIYFVLAGILTFIINKIEIRIDPRRRNKDDILKGVNTDD